MSVRRSLLAVVAVAALAACANLLSYDDYQPRVDAAPIADTSVLEDVRVPVEDADAGASPVRLPPRPAGDAVASGKGKTLWLAARTYSFGMADYAGVESDVAWQTYGYDPDNRCTSELDSRENTGTCRRPTGALQDSLIDGAGCRDNNFLRYVSTLLRTTLPTAESTLNNLVRQGSMTWILHIDDVDAGANDPLRTGLLLSLRRRSHEHPAARVGGQRRPVDAGRFADRVPARLRLGGRMGFR